MHLVKFVKCVRQITKTFKSSMQAVLGAVQCWNPNGSELGKSALNSANSELILSDAALISLMLFVFPESALKNVKSLKQRCSALIISRTTTRVRIPIFGKFCFKLEAFPILMSLKNVFRQFLHSKISLTILKPLMLIESQIILK